MDAPKPGPRRGTPDTQPGALRSSGGGTSGSGLGAALPPQIGPYVVEGEIARGGMGVVLRARHPGLGRRVALKVLLGGREATDRALQRFATEARAVARLRHPNVVGIHEVGRDALGPYLVMDLIEGESLGSRLRRDGPLQPELAARIAQRIADALAYAHQNQVLHRDVKPDNVLLDAHQVPVLTDFGLARELDAERATRLTREGQLVGTPAYTPPEQLMGQTAAIDARADVYSLGATLYEMLSGELPFPQTEQLVLAQAIVEQEPTPPSRHVAGIDRDLETICLTCLEKDPADRYPTAEALAVDLQRWLSDLPIAARPPGLGERLRKWTRRNLALAASLALALALGTLGLVVGSALFIGQARDERDRAREARAEAQEQRDEANAAREAAVAAQAEVQAQHEATQQQLARSSRLLGHALEQKGLRAFEASDWCSAAGFYAAALEREDTPTRRARLGAALNRVWSMTLLPESEGVDEWGWSPDGTRVAACGTSGPLRVWTAEGERVARFELGRVECLAWSPDGARVAVGGRKGELWIADVAAEGLVTVQAHTRVTAVHWLDARRVATRGRDGVLAVWSADAEPISRRQAGPESLSKGNSDWASWGWDGTTAIVLPWKHSGGDQALRWDAASDTLTSFVFPTAHFMTAARTPRGLAVYHGPGLWLLGEDDRPLQPLLAAFESPHAGTGYDKELAWSEDGRWLIKAQRDELLLWDLDASPPSWRRLWPGVRTVSHALSPDGQELAATDGSVVRFWSTETWRPVADRRGLRGQARGLAWEPRGTRLVVRDGEDLVVWRQSGAEPLARLTGARDYVAEVQWSPSGWRLASAGKDGVRVWTPPRASAFEGALPVDPELSWGEPGVWLPGDRLALLGTQRGQQRLAVLDARQGTRLRSLPSACVYLRGASRSGAHLLATGARAEVWDTESWEQTAAFKLSGGLTPLRWSPTRRLFACANGGAIQLRDVRGEVVAEHTITEGGERLSQGLGWSPDGLLLAGTLSRPEGQGGNQPFVLWVLDPERGEVRRGDPRAKGFTLGHELFWSPDARFVATSTSVKPTQTLRVWDSETLQVVHELTGSSGHAANGAFGARRLGWFDGERLLLVDPQAWDAEPVVLPGARYFSWAPDGEVLALHHRDWVQLRDATSGELLFETQAAGYYRLSWSPAGDRLLLQGYGKPPRILSVPHAEGTPAELVRFVGTELGLRLEGLELVPAGR